MNPFKNLYELRRAVKEDIGRYEESRINDEFFRYASLGNIDDAIRSIYEKKIRWSESKIGTYGGTESENELFDRMMKANIEEFKSRIENL